MTVIVALLIAACSTAAPKPAPPGNDTTTESPVTEGSAAEPAAGACTTDAYCRLFSDYCTGCDCRALARSEPDPTCDGPGVRCIADPCGTKAAV